MARLFTDGAEFGDVLFFDEISRADMIEASSALARTGTYCYRSGGQSINFSKRFTAISEIYCRTAIRMATISDITRGIMGLMKGGITGSLLAKCVYVNTGKIALYVGGTYVGQSIASYPANEWHLVEMHYKVDNSAGVLEIKVNGLVAVTYSGDTQPGADTDFDTLCFSIGDGRGDQSYYDDIAANSTAGVTDNSWCGDGHIEILKPNGNGTVNEWVGSDSDSTDNYLLVDEIPYNGDTDYVQDSTPGNQDMYTVQDFDATSKVILHVWAEARAKDTVPDGAEVKLGLHVNGSDYLSSAIPLSSNYMAIRGTEYPLNPDDSAAWEDADLDALEFVVETV